MNANNPEVAAILERLEGLGGCDLKDWSRLALLDNSDPDRAVVNLERWLNATGSPRLYLEQLLAFPGPAHLLVGILGASQPLADTLIQNPELASLVFEPKSGVELSVPDLLREGRTLLEAATSPSHALDRLRFLKQRHTLPIVVDDLSGRMPQETIWRALSDLADALLQLTLEENWARFAAAKNLPEKCPISVVAFGKLGGRELNYSSDIDLVYVAEDSLDSDVERECSRFCEILSRSLSDRMGRGSLYRVDLRLRPYGGAGQILRSLSSYEGYYRLYAEPWEVQALLRSRPIAGADILHRWQSLVTEIVFRPHYSEAFFDEMTKMRTRIEEGASPDDIKRGPGGIRDVEFLTQAIQMANGHFRESIRVAPTCDALRALGESGLLEPSASRELIAGYTFLRKLEHRLQLFSDRQTHEVPESRERRTSLAHLMDLPSAPELESALDRHRRTIQTLYRSILQPAQASASHGDSVADQIGPRGSAVRQWFDAMPEAEAFYESLLQNEGSLARVTKILDHAPRLVESFKASVPLTELLLSGEVEEAEVTSETIDALPMEVPLPALANSLASARIRLLARWVLAPDFNLSVELSRLTEAAVLHAFRRLDSKIDVIALGSFGTQEMAPGSDADLVLLVEQGQSQAEGSAQELLALLGRLHRQGSPLEVDLRLRPDGGKGLLVRTYDGLRAYDFAGMEMWERFALGHGRLLVGNPESMKLVRHCAYAIPLTPERLKELARMKHRIETERVKPQHVRRNVKLGLGGLNDIEWLVHLTEMRYPTATDAGGTTRLDERIRQVGRASLLNIVEVETLLSAHRHLLEVRNRLWLLDFPDDLLPENPDRLNRLALAMGDPDGNAFLRRHEAVIDAVRTIYNETLERLRA